MCKFSLHMRRMELLDVTQTGDPLDLVRELVTLTLSAEWSTFSRQVAICHLFMRNVKCEQSKKICFKLFGENLDGEHLYLSYRQCKPTRVIKMGG